MPNPATPVEPDASIAPDEKLLSLTAAAQQMGISLTFIKVLCGEGKIPSFKLGKRRLIRQADLNAFIQSWRRQAP